MKNIVILTIAIILFGCDYPNVERLVEDGYGKNLSEFVNSHDHQVIDNIIMIHGVNSKNKEIGLLVDIKNFPKQRSFYVDKMKFSKDSWGKSQAKNWGDEGGVSKYAIYYPEQDMLLLGYFSGMDEE